MWVKLNSPTQNIKFCTALFNFVVIQMDMCRKLWTHLLSIRRVPTSRNATTTLIWIHATQDASTSSHGTSTAQGPLIPCGLHFQIAFFFEIRLVLDWLLWLAQIAIASSTIYTGRRLDLYKQKRCIAHGQFRTRELSINISQRMHWQVFTNTWQYECHVCIKCKYLKTRIPTVSFSSTHIQRALRHARSSSVLATDLDLRQAFWRQDRDHRLALHWCALLLRSTPSNLAHTCGTPLDP